MTLGDFIVTADEEGSICLTCPMCEVRWATDGEPDTLRLLHEAVWRHLEDKHMWLPSPLSL